MSGVILHCMREIVIEDYVQLGVGIRIYDGNMQPLLAAERCGHQHHAIGSAPVRICEDVWLGAEAVILKGVTLGARSIVGARTMVTWDVPGDSIVAGVPARVVAKIDNPRGAAELV